MELVRSDYAGAVKRVHLRTHLLHRLVRLTANHLFLHTACLVYETLTFSRLWTVAASNDDNASNLQETSSDDTSTFAKSV